MSYKNVRLAHNLEYGSKILLMLLLFLLPLFFFPFTSDIFEINKQILLLLLTFSSALLWIASMLVSKKVVIKKGLVNLMPVLFIAPFVTSAIFSKDQYISWVGSSSQEYTSVLTIFALSILFYLIINLLKSREDHKKVHLLLLVSSFVTGLIITLSIFGISVFSIGSSISFFNTIGTINSAAVFLIAMTIFASAASLSHKKGDSILHDGKTGSLEKTLIVLLQLQTLFLLLVTDYWVLWLLFISGLIILFVFLTFRSKDFIKPSRAAFPLVLLLVSIPFWLLLKTPFNFEVPTEVTPNSSSSSHIVKSTFIENSPVYGSGPGTYQFDYTKHHGTNINQTNFWNVKFSKGASFFWTLLPTVGYLGLAGTVLFLAFLLIKALTQIFNTSNRSWLESFVALAPWLVLVLAAALYPFNITLISFLFIFSGLLGSQMITEEKTVLFIKSNGVKFFASFIFIVGAFLFFVGIFFSAQIYAAEVSYTKAVKIDRAGGSIEDVVKLVDRAASLNSRSDVYYRSLSVALLHRVNSEIKLSKDSGLTQEKRQYVQSLVGAAVNSSIKATDISPSNVSNWMTRGFIYRELSSLIVGADQFAISSYQKAVELEPANPNVWTELGKTHLAISKQNLFLVSSKDLGASTKAKNDLETNQLKAEEAFEKALFLKTNYGPAHFALGSLYESQGELTEAIKKTEESLLFNKMDAGTYFQIGLLRLKRGARGDVTAAGKALSEAVVLVPSFSQARWYLATVYEKQRELKLAIGQVERISQYLPENMQVKKRLNRLLKGNLSNEIPGAINP
jgi:tetratricopeptide (TPR) repeat protein